MHGDALVVGVGVITAFKTVVALCGRDVAKDGAQENCEENGYLFHCFVFLGLLIC